MKIRFDFALRQISLEGDNAEVSALINALRDLAPSFPSINIAFDAPTNVVTQERAPTGNGELTQVSQAMGQSLRHFVRSLALENNSERIAAIAFYQSRHGGRPTFSPREMGEWFVQCGFPQPGQMPVAVFDAKRKYGFVESAGRGSWRVSRVGENLVIGKREDVIAD